MKTRDQYLKIVEWSEEDQCYIGSCPSLMCGGVHGDDQAKVYQEICQVAEEWIEIYQKDGTPLPAATANKVYSGKFLLRVDKQLHKTLAINALRKGESLNSYCTNLLREDRERYEINK